MELICYHYGDRTLCKVGGHIENYCAGKNKGRPDGQDISG